MAAMVMQNRSRWKLAVPTLVLWALAGASMVYWGLKLWPRPALVAAAPLPAPPPLPAPDAQALAPLFGAQEAAPVPTAAAAPARTVLVLQGVLAGSRSSAGAALIGIDGRPPRPYRIGQEVAPGLWLQALTRDTATLGDSTQGPSRQTLQVQRAAPISAGAPAAAPPPPPFAAPVAPPPAAPPASTESPAP